MQSLTARVRFARHAVAAIAILQTIWIAPPSHAGDLDAAPFTLSSASLLALGASVQVPDTASVSMLRSEQSYRIGADGRVQYVYYSVYRILNAAGADGWNELSAGWSPWKDKRPQLRARVVASDGREFHLDPRTVVDAPVVQGDDSVYSDSRSLRAPLPGIAPGSIVEAEITADEGPSLAGVGLVRRVRFQFGEPIQRMRLTVVVPGTQPFRHRADLLPGLRTSRVEADGQTQWTFEAGPMQALDEIEPGLPRDVPAVPTVTFSTGASWRELAERYSAVVDERIAQSDVAALAERLMRGRDSRDARIEAVVAYLNREIRYTGIEFDQAAIVPRPPSETLRFRYGDCKDKATLLVALLRAGGIPAHVALLEAGVRIDAAADQPGLGLFDHAIVYVPGEPDYWIDATADTSRLRQLPPSSADRLALIAKPDSETLVRTPALRSTENVLDEERTIHLADQGPGRVVEISRPRGAFEAQYRALFADLNRNERRDSLVDYVKSQYGAERMSRAERTDPRDFGIPFALTLEGDRASRAYTNLADATVHLRLGSLFNELPDDLKTREPTEQENARATRPRPKRTADYRLEKPYTAELRYVLVPPAGFEATSLPDSRTRALGPAELRTTFAADGEGRVRATLRFDTVKSRFTAQETIALRNAVAEVLAEDAPRVRFELTPVVLASRGEARKSFEAYRALVARAPNSAIAHVRRAEGLLQSGMGDAARAAARRAVQLDPKSATAQAELARVLQHDPIGREYGEGADRAGAIAAWRAAAAADASEKSHVVNLAILLEHDDRGVRYSPRANLADAIAEYRRLTPEELADLDSQYNLPFALLYARRYAEAKDAALSLGSPSFAVVVAADAMLADASHAIAEARRLSTDDANRREMLRAAGVVLMNLREYGTAAPLIEASAAGPGAAQTLNLAAALRQTRRMESLPPTQDVGEVARRLQARYSSSTFTYDEYLGTLSRSARRLVDTLPPEKRKQALTPARVAQRLAAGVGLLPDALLDIGSQASVPRVLGSEATGYRVSMQAPGQVRMPDLFLLREGGALRVLASADDTTAIGLEVLDRIERGDVAGARDLLDLLRGDEGRGVPEDPYADGAFRLLWAVPTEGADADRVAVAAASLLSNSKAFAGRAVKLLEAAAERTDESRRGPIELALYWAYSTLDDREKALRMATSLASREPNARAGWEGRVRSLEYLGRSAEADAVVQERLARKVGDLQALRVRARSAQYRGDFVAAHARWRDVLASGRAEPTDYNEVAWASLFDELPDGPDLENAGRATQLAPNVPSFLHTLGCVYAEVGRTKEARDILMNALNISANADPDGSYWYAFGRIAEQVGEIDVARTNYAKVDAPERSTYVQATSWHLAQRRLAVIGGKAATPAR